MTEASAHATAVPSEGKPESRAAPWEQVFDDLIVSALRQPFSKDRALLLAADADLDLLLSDDSCDSIPFERFGTLNSFHRLLLHRLGDAYKIRRVMAPTNAAASGAQGSSSAMLPPGDPATLMQPHHLVLAKTPESVRPAMRLSSIVEALDAQRPAAAAPSVASAVPSLTSSPVASTSGTPVSGRRSPQDDAASSSDLSNKPSAAPTPSIRIMSRQSSTPASPVPNQQSHSLNGSSGSGSQNGKDKTRTGLTLEQREAAYLEARERIFKEEEDKAQQQQQQQQQQEINSTRQPSPALSVNRPSSQSHQQHASANAKLRPSAPAFDPTGGPSGFVFYPPTPSSSAGHLPPPPEGYEYPPSPPLDPEEQPADLYEYTRHPHHHYQMAPPPPMPPPSATPQGYYVIPAAGPPQATPSPAAAAAAAHQPVAHQAPPGAAVIYPPPPPPAQDPHVPAYATYPMQGDPHQVYHHHHHHVQATPPSGGYYVYHPGPPPQPQVAPQPPPSSHQPQQQHHEGNGEPVYYYAVPPQAVPPTSPPAPPHEIARHAAATPSSQLSPSHRPRYVPFPSSSSTSNTDHHHPPSEASSAAPHGYELRTSSSSSSINSHPSLSSVPPSISTHQSSTGGPHPLVARAASEISVASSSVSSTGSSRTSKTAASSFSSSSKPISLGPGLPPLGPMKESYHKPARSKRNKGGRSNASQASDDLASERLSDAGSVNVEREPHPLPSKPEWIKNKNVRKSSSSSSRAASISSLNSALSLNLNVASAAGSPPSEASPSTTASTSTSAAPTHAQEVSSSSQSLPPLHWTPHQHPPPWMRQPSSHLSSAEGALSQSPAALEWDLPRASSTATSTSSRGQHRSRELFDPLKKRGPDANTTPPTRPSSSNARSSSSSKQPASVNGSSGQSQQHHHHPQRAHSRSSL